MNRLKIFFANEEVLLVFSWWWKTPAFCRHKDLQRRCGAKTFK